MENNKSLNVGDRVHYKPAHYGEDVLRYENGIVKAIPENDNQTIRVVYNCANDWSNYQNYTSALTHVRDLEKGWVEK
jgi:hypothetical protein